MTQHAWTPASRPGIVPLRPLGFGTILGRSFTALRHNPRVLLGFALVVQAIGALVATAVLVAVGVLTFSRLASLQPGSDDFETVMAGSVALLGVIGVVVTTAATALAVIVQGVVVAEVTHAVVAEKLTLGRLWRRIRPVAWRLVGYGLLATLAILLGAAAVFGVFFLLTTVAGTAGFLLALPVALGAFVLSLWLTTKLMLVPAVIVVERAGIRRAIVRSWTLIRGRFWVGLGVTFIISASFGALAQVVSVPLSIASLGVTTIVTPTGETDTSAVIAFLIGSAATQLVIFLLQCVSLIVSATAATLVYVDCRMRHEGLDLDLLRYVEERDAGAASPADPYTLHIGRRLDRRWTPPAWPPPATSPPHPAWPPPAPVAAPAPAAARDDTPSPTRWTPPGAGPS